MASREMERESAGVDATARDRLREVAGAAKLVVGLTVALATCLELLLVISAVLTGQTRDGAGPFVLDWLQKLPWALIVCVGVWIGLRAGHGRSLVLGLAALLAAPTGSLASRTAAQALQATAFGAGAVAQSTYAPAAPAGPPALAIAGLRGMEYLSLALAVGWLVRRPRAGPHHHAAVGLAAGAVFGTGLLALTAAATGGQLLSPDAMPAWAINELLFPAGCALILYAARPEQAGAEPEQEQEQEVEAEAEAEAEAGATAPADADNEVGGRVDAGVTGRAPDG